MKIPYSGLLKPFWCLIKCSRCGNCVKTMKVIFVIITEKYLITRSLITKWSGNISLVRNLKFCISTKCLTKKPFGSVVACMLAYMNVCMCVCNEEKMREIPFIPGCNLIVANFSQIIYLLKNQLPCEIENHYQYCRVSPKTTEPEFGIIVYISCKLF